MSGCRRGAQALEWMGCERDPCRARRGLWPSQSFLGFFNIFFFFFFFFFGVWLACQ